MTLEEAISKHDCSDMRELLKKFLSEVRGNIIATVLCPVCGGDLRACYQPSLVKEKTHQGWCKYCHLRIQATSFIKHEDHVLPPLETNGMPRLCSFTITIPLALVTMDVRMKLRKKWVDMGLPCRPLTERENNDWMHEVSSILKTIRM